MTSTGIWVTYIHKDYWSLFKEQIIWPLRKYETSTLTFLTISNGNKVPKLHTSIFIVFSHCVRSLAFISKYFYFDFFWKQGSLMVFIRTEPIHYSCLTLLLDIFIYFIVIQIWLAMVFSYEQYCEGSSKHNLLTSGTGNM